MGEMALYGMRRRTASIVALERSDCLVVKRRIFEYLLKSFPEEKKYFDGIAKARKEALIGRNRKPAQKEEADGGDGTSSDEGDLDNPRGDLPPVLPDGSNERASVMMIHPLDSQSVAWTRKKRRETKKNTFRFSSTSRSSLPSVEEKDSPRGGKYNSKTLSIRVPSSPSKGSGRRAVGVLGLERALKQ